MTERIQICRLSCPESVKRHQAELSSDSSRTIAPSLLWSMVSASRRVRRSRRLSARPCRLFPTGMSTRHRRAPGATPRPLGVVRSPSRAAVTVPERTAASRRGGRLRSQRMVDSSMGLGVASVERARRVPGLAPLSWTHCRSVVRSFAYTEVAVAKSTL